MGARSDKKPLASPGDFFPRRKRRVTKLLTGFLRRSFLPLPHFAAVYHHIMRVALSLDLDLAKLHQSCFHISKFCCLELKARDTDSRLSGALILPRHSSEFIVQISFGSVYAGR